MSIFDVKPNEISRSLSDYSFMIYGEPKTGKTTIASQFPGHILLAFEKGYNAIPGVMAKPMKSWREMIMTMRELDSDEAKERFQTVIIDTVDLAFDACDKYICNQNNVDSIGDLPYGKGYQLVQKEFDDALRGIVNMGYGIVLISHSEDKQFVDENGVETHRIKSTLSKGASKVVTRLCDFIGYARTVEVPDEGLQTMLFLRGTTRFEAGSRFAETPPYIPFTFEAMSDMLDKAIQAKEDSGAIIVDSREEIDLGAQEEVRDIQELIGEAGEIVQQILAKDEDKAPNITYIVEKYLGAGRLLSNASYGQEDQALLIIEDLGILLASLQD